MGDSAVIKRSIATLLVSACILACCLSTYAQQDAAADAQRYVPGDSHVTPADSRVLSKHYRRLQQQVLKQLKRMRRDNSKQKQAEDWFVVGTAVLDPQTLHADVCFKTIRGQQQAADSIVTFLVEPTKGPFRQWQAFHRAEAEEQAAELLASVRSQYDQAVAYRDMLMKRFGAKTIRRT